MKKVCLLSLFLLSASCFAQDSLSVKKSIYGFQVGFLGVWAHNEARISNKIALRTELGFDFGITQNNFNDKTLPYIFSSGGRIKYKGDDLGDDVLGQLDQYIGTLGYQRIKEKDKDYGVKYVWAKQ